MIFGWGPISSIDLGFNFADNLSNMSTWAEGKQLQNLSFCLNHGYLKRCCKEMDMDPIT